ncbi:hypothetical protein A6U98_01435 [Rhizobium sp. WYCCWR10014]|uniref:hypothetical protein n=1 Tax=Rhizobium sp. WYCCWR10014 TaxID=1825933 RepID=UPI0007E4C1D4|nr:hypothetical protein [Rhizobium sp. WYCCWR10014]OAV51476.1 hypothetical protein A6U98_01435 [Rhizobium sp. WYCCWR10014]
MMTDQEGAAILFAETRGWRADQNDPEQVRYARRALAQGLIASEGKGFGSGLRPTANDFGDPEILSAWQDCFAAVRSARTSMASPTLGYIINETRPTDDNRLRTMARGLTASPVGDEFGPFFVDGGVTPFKLYVYESVQDVGPGLFPSKSGARQTAKTNNFRNPIVASLTVVVCLALFLLVSLYSFWQGAAASQNSLSAQSMASRLADSIKAVDPRLSDEANAIAAQIVTEAKLKPDGRQAWWQGPSTGNNANITNGPSTTDIEALETSARQVTGQRIAGAAALAALDEAERTPVRDKAMNAVAAAVRNDPVLVPTFVNLAGIWLGAVLLLTVVAGVVGKGFYGSVLGVLIDSRNRLSLSRLQVLFWSVLVLSLFSVTSIFLVGATGTVGALPQYPWAIWALLGISIGTTPLSGLILLSKSTQPPQPNAEQSIMADPNSTNVGRVEVNLSQNGWSFLDFFRGEEVANRNEIDISRFQYFVITLVLMIIFVGLVTNELWTLQTAQDWLAWAKDKSYPHLNETFIGLLALSHGSYLGMKLLAKPDVSPNG